MIQIKLQKVSSGVNPSYLVVVKNRYDPISAGFIERIGFYVPRADKLKNKYLFLDLDRFAHWVANGASVNSDLYLLSRDLLYIYEN